MTLLEWIGHISGVIGIVTLAIYVRSRYALRTEICLRLADAENLRVTACHPNGRWLFGVSTQKEVPIVLTECGVASETSKLKLFGSPEFLVPQPTPKGVELVWRGSEELSRGTYFVLPVRYETSEPISNGKIRIRVTASLKPESWTAPWSMFNLQPCSDSFDIEFNTSPTASERGIRVPPGESMKITGPLAAEAVHASADSGEIEADITEIMQDGSYQKVRLRRKFPPSST